MTDSAVVGSLSDPHRGDPRHTAAIASVTSVSASPVYLDAATAAPMHPVARQALLAALDDGWADPGKLYTQARRARQLLDAAREATAPTLGVRADEVSFTPSGTTAAHGAVLGGLAGRRRVGCDAGALGDRALGGAARGGAARRRGRDRQRGAGRPAGPAGPDRVVERRPGPGGRAGRVDYRQSRGGHRAAGRRGGGRVRRRGGAAVRGRGAVGRPGAAAGGLVGAHARARTSGAGRPGWGCWRSARALAGSRRGRPTSGRADVPPGW